MKQALLFTLLLIMGLLVMGFILMGCEPQPEGENTTVKNDEQAVRHWFELWIKASTEGDLELAKTLIADDAVFLVPFAGEMDKESFAAAATATDPSTEFELDCSIQELEIIGDHAWLQVTLNLAMTDRRSGSRSVMAGHGLSVLRREGDGWVVIRDANTMVPVEQ